MRASIQPLRRRTSAAEKTWRWGPGLSRVVGVAALILAVAVVFWPSLAAGLDQAPGMSGGGMSHGAMRTR